jgi:hypothetical protein
VSTNKHENKSVAETVWSWREPEQPPDVARKNRIKGLIQGTIGALVATLIFFYISQHAAYVVYTITGLITLTALASPAGLFPRIELGFEKLGAFLGQMMSWLLLGPIYFIFFSGFHLLFRRGKKDAMTRWLDPQAESYWNERSGPPEAIRYEKQY